MVKSDQHRQNELVVSATVLTAISTAIVLVRTILRGCVIRKFGWDDGLILGALGGTIGYLICVYILRANHIGFPMTTLTLDNMLGFMKATLAIQVLYYTVVTCIKLSILCMYLRIAVSQTVRRLVYGTIALHAAFYVVCLAGTLAQCRPLHKMWDFAGIVPGTCINTTAFFYFTSSFNILTDFWILALPIKTLININRPVKEKIALVGIFLVGAFATIISIVRLHSIKIYTEAQDPFRSGLLVNIWSMTEINAAIMCASVPALKPLFTPQKLRELTYGSSGANRTGGQHHFETAFKNSNQSKSRILHSRDEKAKGAEEWDMAPLPSNKGNVRHMDSSESGTTLAYQR